MSWLINFIKNGGTLKGAIREFFTMNGRMPRTSEMNKMLQAFGTKGDFKGWTPKVIEGGKSEQKMGLGQFTKKEDAYEKELQKAAEEVGLGELRKSFTKKYPPHKVSNKLGFRRKEYPAGVEPGSVAAKAIDEADAILGARAVDESVLPTANAKASEKAARISIDKFKKDLPHLSRNDIDQLTKDLVNRKLFPDFNDTQRKEVFDAIEYQTTNKPEFASGGLAHMLGEGGRIGFATGRLTGQPYLSRVSKEETSEKIFKKLIEIAKTLESEEQKYMYEVTIPKTLMKLSADVGTKESTALRNFLSENPDLTKVDLSNIPLKFNDNTHLKTMLEIPIGSDIKAKITGDSSMTGSDLDKIKLTSKNLDIEYDKKRNEIDTDLNFDIGKGDINLSRTNYLNDNTNASRLDITHPFNKGNLKATAFAEGDNIYGGELGYIGDGSRMKLYLDKDREPSISAKKELDNITLNTDLSLDKDDYNQIGVEWKPKEHYLKNWIRPDNFSLFANQDIGEGGTTIGADYNIYDEVDEDTGNRSRLNLSYADALDGDDRKLFLKYMKNFDSSGKLSNAQWDPNKQKVYLKEPYDTSFQTNNPDEAIDFLSSKRNFFNSGGIARLGFKDGKGLQKVDLNRRLFLQGMGALASLPIVGKFFKLAKPLAKTKDIKVTYRTGVNEPYEWDDVATWGANYDFESLTPKGAALLEELFKKNEKVITTKDKTGKITKSVTTDTMDGPAYVDDIKKAGSDMELEHVDDIFGDAPIYKPIKKDGTKLTPKEQFMNSYGMRNEYDGSLYDDGIDEVYDVIHGTEKMASGGRAGFDKGGLLSPQMADFINNYSDQMTFEQYLQMMSNKMASGGRATFYFGGDVKPDMSDIGHGSDSLMSRTRLVSPNSMATTSTGLNYLLAEDNDNVRIPYAKGGVAKILEE